MPITSYLEVINHFLPNVPTGIKNAPTIPPMIMINLIAQKPFCIPALGSLEVLTFIMIRENSKKNNVTMKHSLKIQVKIMHWKTIR